jgi:hypothetical protein
MSTDALFAQAATPPPDGIPVLLAADLQDHLMVASNDLDRLQRLLEDACQSLMSSFVQAREQIGGAEVGTEQQAMAEALGALSQAITALQFQDMASQLVSHTMRRLRNCADRLAHDAMGGDDDGAAVIEQPPLRPNPVTQDEMDAGSIELF